MAKRRYTRRELFIEVIYGTSRNDTAIRISCKAEAPRSIGIHQLAAEAGIAPNRAKTLAASCKAAHMAAGVPMARVNLFVPSSHQKRARSADAIH